MFQCRCFLTFLLVTLGSGKYLLSPATGCEDVPDPENGIGRKTESGSVITFQCFNGYSLRGLDRITCTGEGWSGTVPKCISDEPTLPRADATCLTSPPYIQGSLYELDRRTHDDGDEYYIVIYKCLQGYLLSSGGTSVICSEGQWIWLPEGQINCTPTCSAPTFYCEHSCMDRPTGATCTCIPGYYLYENGRNCFNVNECLTEGVCGHGVCQDLIGSYRCHCFYGYRLVNGRCEDNDECEYQYQCQNGRCINTVGSYRCQCDEGYRAHNSIECYDINECSEDPSLCQNGRCYNYFPGYICVCEYGFKQSQDLMSCEDVDECDTEDNRCDHTCTNTVGSYTCGCDDGYILGNDRATCLLDREKPSVISCPEKQSVESQDRETAVTWNEPRFTDNSGTELTITQTHHSGDEFVWGSHVVSYTARDHAGHKAVCSFTIEIGATKCENFPAPINGARACDQWLFGTFCRVYCNKKYEFSETPAHWYICGANSLWTTSPPSIPVPWPNCSERKVVGQAHKGLKSQYYAGNCNEQKTKKATQKAFIKAFEASVFSTTGCSTEDSCVIEKVTVYCGELN